MKSQREMPYTGMAVEYKGERREVYPCPPTLSRCRKMKSSIWLHKAETLSLCCRFRLYCSETCTIVLVLQLCQPFYMSLI